MPVIYNITGRRYGKLMALHVGAPLGNRRRWVCRCDCGTITTVVTGSLTGGKTRSCGCLIREVTRARSTTHGAASRGYKSGSYKAWANMRSRCLNPNHRKYPNYGGRGITICERWAEFENFRADMGEPPEGKTLDRTNNALGYSFDNCAWRTPAEQNRNRRDNVHLTARGRTLTVTEWGREPGSVSRKTIVRRLAKGWSHEDAIFRPV